MSWTFHRCIDTRNLFYQHQNHPEPEIWLNNHNPSGSKSSLISGVTQCVVLTSIITTFSVFKYCQPVANNPRFFLDNHLSDWDWLYENDCSATDNHGFSRSWKFDVKLAHFDVKLIYFHCSFSISIFKGKIRSGIVIKPLIRFIRFNNILQYKKRRKID